jgi:tetratricopeptide (TPR) repeat protein
MAALVLNVAIDRIRAGPPGAPTRTVVVPTLPPEWTPTPSPTTGPSRTPAPTLQETAGPGLQADLPTVALQQMWGQNYEGAIETWAQVIQQDPGNHQAYYGRAYSYLRLTRGLGMHTVFVEYSQAALADAEQAIALSPEPNGNYYLARSWAFENLALAAYLRLDRDRLNEVALENMRVGISLPHNEPLVIYAPVELLLRLGRCDEALQEADRLEQERGTGLAPSPNLTYYQGVGLLCKGRYQEALDALIVARNAYGDCEYDYQQAVALYLLGRTDEALSKLTTMIGGCPTYDGYWYYLRALIWYERGGLERVEEDLLQGLFTTWDWRGLKAYIEARMLADEGQRQEARERMQQAEVTFERTRGPFLDRIRRELAALGGRPISATPQPLPEATPIPSLPPDHPTPPPVVRVLHNAGSGALEISPGGTLMLHFRGPSGFTYTKARILQVYLVSAEITGGPELEMQLFDPSKQWWEDFDPRWGQNTIAAPDRFFYGSGDLFIRLHNPGQSSVSIYDVGLDLSVIDGHGEHVRWSFLES